MKKETGFGLIDSMVALGILAGITMAVITYHARNTRYKEAKELAGQTEIFATTFARYMNDTDVIQRLQSGTKDADAVVLTPQMLSIAGAWPTGLASQNLFRQIPCVAVVQNKSTHDLEAVMYYVGGSGKHATRDGIKIAQNALVLLGGRGGVVHDGAIIGNSGFNIPRGSAFLQVANQCGGELTENGLAINMDLLFEWKQNLEPGDSLLRGEDPAHGGITTLPGHVQNANTAKANIYFAANNGVIFDNADAQNPVKLAIMYNGHGTLAPTLGLGDKRVSTLIGDTLQSSVQASAGEVCDRNELGKIVADRGIADPRVNQMLARSNLVCSSNDLLCTRSSSHTCYLPSIANNIVFKNETQGVQDSNGMFRCPLSIPFAVSATTNLVNAAGDVYVFYDLLGLAKSLNGVSTLIGYPNMQHKWQDFQCQSGSLFKGCIPESIFPPLTDFKTSASNYELLGIDLSSIKGDKVTSIGGASAKLPVATAITGVLNAYQVNMGYKVDLNNVCNSVCSQLDTPLQHNWQALGMQRISRIGSADFVVASSNLGCGCEREDFIGNNLYDGIAAIITAAPPKAILTSVTCSNMPTYSVVSQ